MFASESSELRHTPTRHRAGQQASTGRSRWGRLPCGPSTSQAISPFPRLLLWYRSLPGFAGWLAATESRSVQPI